MLYLRGPYCAALPPWISDSYCVVPWQVRIIYHVEINYSSPYYSPSYVCIVQWFSSYRILLNSFYIKQILQLERYVTRMTSRMHRKGTRGGSNRRSKETGCPSTRVYEYNLYYLLY